MIAVTTEKITAKYLLVEIESGRIPRLMPRECCESAGVPDFCLGLCTPVDERSVVSKLNACSKYEAIIENCFQPEEVRHINKHPGFSFDYKGCGPSGCDRARN